VQVTLPVQLLLFRTAGIVIPVYIILVSVTALLHWCNQRRIFRIQVHFRSSSSFFKRIGQQSWRLHWLKKRIPIPASFTNNHNVNFLDNAGCARDDGFRTSWSRGPAAYHQHSVGSCTDARWFLVRQPL
jgi:hypothetical protein